MPKEPIKTRSKFKLTREPNKKQPMPNDKIDGKLELALRYSKTYNVTHNTIKDNVLPLLVSFAAAAEVIRISTDDINLTKQLLASEKLDHQTRLDYEDDIRSAELTITRLKTSISENLTGKLIFDLFYDNKGDETAFARRWKEVKKRATSLNYPLENAFLVLLVYSILETKSIDYRKQLNMILTTLGQKTKLPIKK